MARKRQRRIPQVPQSSAEGTVRVPGATAVYGDDTPRTAKTSTLIHANFAEEYSYVKNDLIRIVSLASLLVAGLFALSFVV